MSEPPAAALPRGLAAGFLVAAAELGMASAARLFVGEVGELRGGEGVAALRDALGRDYPVVDFVASAWLDGRPLDAPDPAPVVAALGPVRRVLVVGVEADALDRLVAALPRDVALGLAVGGGGLEPDASRVAANHPGRLEVVALGGWTRWAGARSGLVTFVYGCDGQAAFVVPAYLRLVGPDVRTAFRSLVGWDVLGGVPRLHPRFLAGAAPSDFSAIVPFVPAGGAG
jgi:hypothetical protein